jgi:hypothetical protein
VRQPLGQGRLQAVVVGIGLVRLPVDKVQIGEVAEAAGVAVVGTDAVAASAWSALIDVDKTSQSVAAIGDIANLQREVAADGVLDTEVPIHDVRRFEIRVHRPDVAR